MSYKILSKMSSVGENRPLYDTYDKAFPDNNGFDLRSSVRRFIHDRCENLRVVEKKHQEEDGKNVEYTGKSGKIAVPYNMEMDIDRLCLENALDRFLNSGSARDAFDVYFCYIEMFMDSYVNSRHVVEMLSEFESNGSSLLMKHRDHYSHSVYVFAIGLAVFETNSGFRKAYYEFYANEIGKDADSAKAIGKDADSAKAAAHFLEYWGLTSLFHDIGYPFELPFEQVCSYFEEKRSDNGEFGRKIKRTDAPFIAYCDVEKFTTLSKEQSEKLLKIYAKEERDLDFFQKTDDLFAYDLEQKLGRKYRFSKESMAQVLKGKPVQPDSFGYFMDHAYFSANILFWEMWNCFNGNIGKTHIDSLTAILLHNSLYKHSIAFVNSKEINIPLDMRLHPLAFILMLCDELQCWDRTAYGRNSRIELHPMDCRFEFKDGTIKAEYIFDKNEKVKIDKARKGEKVKAYSSFYKGDFQKDIENIVSCEAESGIPIEVTETTDERNTETKKVYLSESSFIHLYNFAASLSARYEERLAGNEEQGADKEVIESFNELSLEYKLSNINQAKAFAEYLNVIGCFYTDRPVDFDLFEGFSEKDMNIIGPLEHGRWLKEHEDMGWIWGESYEKDFSDKKEKKTYRELRREHKLMIKDKNQSVEDHYNDLPKEEQGKDTDPMNSMLKLIRQFDGLRVYRYK